MRRTWPITLMSLLALPLTGMAQPTAEEPVLIRIGDHAFDPADPSARERFHVAGDAPGRGVGWILQFEGPLVLDQIRRLRDRYGLTLQEYVPDNGYLVWLAPEQVTRLVRQESDLYRGHVRYGAQLKLPEWIQEIAGTKGVVQLRITPFDAVDVKELANEIRALAPERIDVETVGDREPRLVVEIPLNAVGDLAAFEGIRRIEDLPFRTEDRAGAHGLQLTTERNVVPPRREEEPLEAQVEPSWTRTEAAVFDTSSANEIPRHWTEIIGGLGIGRDSNPLLIGEGSSSPGDKWDTHLIGYGGVDYRRTSFDDDRKTWELGIQGNATWVQQQDVDQASQLDWTVSAYTDREVFPPKPGTELFRPTYRAGLLVRHSEIRVDDDAFAEVDQAILGSSIAYRERGDCELSRLFVFVSVEDIDDRLPEIDPALSRSGSTFSAGIRRSFGPGGDNLHDLWTCQGGGTFRKLFLENYWTFHSEYVRRKVNTEGTEFDRDEDVVRIEGRWPLWRKELDPLIYRSRIALDADLTYERSRFSAESLVSGTRRKDDVTVADVGLIFPVLLQSEGVGRVPQRYVDLSLRLGTQFTNNRSNIAVYDYDRTVYGASLYVIWGQQNAKSMRRTDPENPGSTSGVDVGSGSKRPKPDPGG